MEGGRGSSKLGTAFSFIFHLNSSLWLSEIDHSELFWHYYNVIQYRVESATLEVRHRRTYRVYPYRLLQLVGEGT